MIRACIVLVLGWLSSGAACAAAAVEGPQPETSFLDSLLTLDPDLAQAIAELDESGFPLGDAELLSALSIVGRGEVPRPIAPQEADGGLQFAGTLRTRVEPLAEAGSRTRMRGQANLGRIGFRGSLRARDDRRSARGFAEYATDDLQIRAGDLGLDWGAGLLCAAPGRRSSLAAGSPLGRAAAGPASGGGGGERQAVVGAAWNAGRGRWRTVGLIGRPDPAASAESRLAAGWRYGGGERSCGVLVLHEEGGAAAASWQAGIRVGDWSGHVECAAERPQRPRKARRAVAARLGWRRGRTAWLEALVVGAAGGRWWESGRRPALLPRDSGSGWALRGGLRTAKVWSGSVLLARAAAVDPRRSDPRMQRASCEVQLRWRPVAHSELDLRWRRRLDREFIRSERYPWLPPEPEPPQTKSVFSVRFRRELDHGWGGTVVRVLGRSYSTGDGITVDQRHVLQWDLSRDLRFGSKLRCGGAAAWGGRADLVTALSPLPGKLVLRHWGHWRSESWAGLEASPGPLRISAAAARRRPETGAPPGDSWNLWLEAVVAF